MIIRYLEDRPKKSDLSDHISKISSEENVTSIRFQNIDYL